MKVRCSPPPVAASTLSGRRRPGAGGASARRAGHPRRAHLDVACTGLLPCCSRHRAKVSSTSASARGADSARPVALLRPRRPRCESISARGSGFVIRSAGFSVPNTLYKRHALERTRSCTHSCATARWRTLPIPVRLQMPIAAELSACTSGCNSTPRARATVCMRKASLKPRSNAPNSA